MADDEQEPTELPATEPIEEIMPEVAELPELEPIEET